MLTFILMAPQFLSSTSGSVPDIDEQNMINVANKVRLKLNQKSLGIEFNNRLILISES